MAIRKSDLMPLMKSIGCGWGLVFNRSEKIGEHEDKISLWLSTRVPSSQTRVTSVKSVSPLICTKVELAFAWKSSHLRQRFSVFSITRAESGWFVGFHLLLVWLLLMGRPQRFHLTQPHSSSCWTSITGVSSASKPGLLNRLQNMGAALDFYLRLL